MGRKKKCNKKTSTTVQPVLEVVPPENVKPVKTNLVAEHGETVETKVAANQKIPIDIYSRLTYPLVHPSTSNQSEDSDDEDTVEINFWPRFVFMSNLCIICMEQSTVLCEHCGMISYCSIKHRMQGWPKHRDLCRILTEICANEGSLSLAKELSPDQYRVYRLKLIEIIECGMNRPLELWEKEIILYPRVCRSCRDASNNLNCCIKCGVDFFCNDHRNDHDRWCEDFQVLRRILVMQFRHGHVEPEIPSVMRKSPLTLPENFDSLMAQLYGRSSYYCKMDCHTYSTLSYVSTIPLTALYAMQKSYGDWENASDFVIHVIGAEFQFECMNLYVWEKLFLHFLPALKSLTLIFVGPELRLPDVPVDLLARVKMCRTCKAAEKVVNVVFVSGKFYHEYSSSKQFAKPSLLCLFNPGLYRETAFNGKDSWPLSIREFCKTNVPVVVTSYTNHEIPQEMRRIESISDVEVILEPAKNPFASLKPDRNFVSDDTVPLIYKNYYIAIVKGKE